MAQPVQTLLEYRSRIAIELLGLNRKGEVFSRPPYEQAVTLSQPKGQRVEGRVRELLEKS